MFNIAQDSNTNLGNTFSETTNFQFNQQNLATQNINTQNNIRTVVPVANLYGAPPTDFGKILDTELKIDQSNFVILRINTVGELQYTGSSVVNAFQISNLISDFQEDVATVSGLSFTAGFPLKFVLNSPTVNEQLTNEYSQSVLEQSLNFVGETLKDYTYLTAQNPETLGKMIDSSFGGASQAAGDMLSSVLSTVGKLTGMDTADFQGKSLGQQIGTGLNKLGQMTQGSALGNVLKGYRVDVPMVWKGSTINKSINAKIKLYAVADNEESITQNVILPYAILKVLSAPRSDDGSYMYKWPYIMSAEIPGLIKLPMCAVTSASFSKPGQNEVYTHSGKFLNIDVNLTITPLYNTEFVLKGNTGGNTTMLTVNDDIENLKNLLL